MAKAGSQRGPVGLRMPPRRLCKWRKGPRAKDCEQPLEAGKGQEASPPEPPEGTQLCQSREFGPLTPVSESDCQNRKRVSSRCSQALRLGSFVTAATRHRRAAPLGKFPKSPSPPAIYHALTANISGERPGMPAASSSLAEGRSINTGLHYPGAEGP